MFITIEGLDASGKTTLLNLVAKKLSDNNIQNTVINKHAVDYSLFGYTGKKLSSLSDIIFTQYPEEDLTRIPNSTWILLNASWYSIISRNCFNSNIKSGAPIYLSDSWIYKRIARFSLLEEYSLDMLEMIYKDAAKPDITFFMNTPPEVTWTRRAHHSRKDFGFLNTSYENCDKEHFIKYQKSIYSRLLELSSSKKWIYLDWTQEIEMNMKIILNKITQTKSDK